MKNLIIIFLIIIFFSINNCGRFQEAMTGQRQKTTDEFLVKKKDPLILPPKYEELPLPKSQKKERKTSSLESIVGASKGTNVDSKNSISSLEQMILKELRK